MPRPEPTMRNIRKVLRFVFAGKSKSSHHRVLAVDTPIERQ